MREGRKGERPEATPPIMPRGVDLFLYTRKHVPGFSSNSPLVFVFLVSKDGGSPFSVSGLFLFAGSVWHLQSSRRGDEIRWRRNTVRLRIFPARVRTVANISQEFPGNEGAQYACWTQEPQLKIF